MTDWGLVLDASTSRVTREDWRRLKDMGFRGFIQCLQTGGFSSSQTAVRAVAEPNLHDADAEGIGALGGYLNSQPWRAPEVIHADARAVAGGAWSGLPFVANDVEIKDAQTGQVPSAAQIERTTQLIKAEGKRTAYYTASWYWRGVLGNPTWAWLLEDPLWNAYYDGDPDIDFRNAPYGPWTQAHVIGEQYQGTTNLGGDLFDLNFFDLDYLREPTTKEDDVLNDDDKRWIEEKINAIDGARWNSRSIDMGRKKPDGTPDPLTPWELLMWHTQAFDQLRFEWLMGIDVGNEDSQGSFKRLVQEAAEAAVKKLPAAQVNVTGVGLTAAVINALKNPDVLAKIAAAVVDEDHRRSAS